MKCPVCWAEKAYVRHVGGWRGRLLACLLVVPLQCHHCYHKFHVFWFQTLGKPTTPPPLRIAPNTRGARPSYAARKPVARKPTVPPAAEDTSPRRADAA